MVSPVARWSTPFTVGTSAFTFRAPSIAAVGSGVGNTGTFVIVWTDSGDSLDLGDDSGTAIYGQLYNEDGSANGTPFLVNSTDTGDQHSAVVVDRTSDQGFAVAFRDQDTGDVYLRLFDVDGNAEGNDAIVNDGGPTEGAIQSEPSIARGVEFGQIFTTWSDSGGAPDGDGADIRGKVGSNADIRITTTDHSGAGETNVQIQSNVAALPNTGFVVTWVDNVSAGNPGSAIRGQLYSSTGVAVGTEFTVASTPLPTTNQGVTAPVSTGFDGSINDGIQFVTAWVQDDDATAPGVDLNVHARLFSISGTTPVGGTDIILSESTAGNQSQVVVASYSSIGGFENRFIAVWTDQAPFQPPTVRARMFDLEGNAVTDEFIVNPEGSTGYQLADVAVLYDIIDAHPQPRFVITWREDNGTIRGQIFDPNASMTLGIDWYGSERPETYTAQYDEHVLAGNGGNDNLTGSAIADTLRGNADSDTLFGLAGMDILDGGFGQDDMTGGGGADTFDFNHKAESVRGVNRDVIMDFSGILGGELDLINLATIDAKKGGGNQKFKYIGGAKFHHKEGELQVKYNADTDTAIVQGDIDGNGKADFQIEVHSLAALQKLDFVL